jgi:replicative DNA helicase
MDELRLLPSVPAAEKALLGSALISASASELLLRSVTQKEFYEPANRAIYGAIAALHSRGAAVDVLTVPEELRKRGWLERAGGKPYLHAVCESTPTSVHAEHYAKEVRDAAIFRELVLLSGKMEEAGYQAKEDAQAVLDGFSNDLHNLSKRIESWDLVSAAVAHDQQQEELDNDKSPVLFKLGIDDLDQVLNLHPGDLVVLSGQTSIGKSATALHWLTSAASCGTPCLMVTLEMSRRQCEDRVLAGYGGLPLTAVMRRKLTPDQKRQAREMNEVIRVMPLHYVEKSGGSVEALCSMLRDARRKHGIEIVVVDQLNRLNPQSATESERRDIDHCVRLLKDVAMNLGVVVILLHQLNRTNNLTDRPMMEQLRGSGAIAQDSDAVLLAHRPGRKKAKTKGKEEEDDSLLEWYCDKQRNGPPGWTRQRIFRKSTQSIFTLEQAAHEGYQREPEEEDEADDWRTG